MKIDRDTTYHLSDYKNLKEELKSLKSLFGRSQRSRYYSKKKKINNSHLNDEQTLQ